MRKPATNVCCSDRLERLFDGVDQRVNSARLGASQIRFALRPTRLNGMQVWRIGRQGQQSCPTRGDQRLDARDLVRWESVPPHDLPWPQCGPPDVASPLATDGALHRTVHAPRGVEAFAVHGAPHGPGDSIVLGHMLPHPLPRRRPPRAAGHREVGARCSDELQPPDVERRDGLPEGRAQGLDAGRLTLRGVERLFFRGSRSRWSARQMVASLPRAPCAATTRSRNSSRVAAGCWAPSGRNVSVWSLRERTLPPACGIAAQLPAPGGGVHEGRENRVSYRILCGSYHVHAIANRSRSINPD
jgi:hypothetical protein